MTRLYGSVMCADFVANHRAGGVNVAFVIARASLNAKFAARTNGPYSIPAVDNGPERGAQGSALGN